jgi:hypothetical protein
MNITALIKISAEIPHGAVSQVTGDYLLSMAEAEREHNARVAFLSERGSRVASQPSEYWQRAFATHKWATQTPYASDTVELYTEALESHHNNRVASVGGASLTNLIDSYPLLKRVISAAAQQDAKLRGRDLKRTQDRAPKAEGRKSDRKQERLEAQNLNPKAELARLENEYKDDSTNKVRRNAIIKKVKAMIRGGKKISQTPRLKALIDKWNDYLNGKTLLKDPSYDRDSGRGSEEVQWNTLMNKEETREYAIGKRTELWVKPLFTLAKKEIGSSDSEGDKSEGDSAPKSEGGSAPKSDGADGAKKEVSEEDKKKKLLDGIKDPKKKAKAEAMLSEGKDADEVRKYLFGKSKGSAKPTEESVTGTDAEVDVEVSAKTASLDFDIIF